jgi:putative aldouronate transport system permease protein
MVKAATTRGDKIFDIGINTFLILVLIVTIVPLGYVVIISVAPLVMPNQPTPIVSFAAYSELLSQPSFLRATINSTILLIGGVSLNMILTTLSAFALSRKTLPGRGAILGFILFTFLFNAGLIPQFLLVKNLGLLDTLPSVVLPGAISVYNLLIMMAFLQNLPESLGEAARIDGASEFQVLRYVILPLSKPILLTVALFYAVNNWNEFFLPILFLNDKDLMPLPVVLRDILSSLNSAEYIDGNRQATIASPEAIKMAAVILTTLPMLMIYPWIQRHFTKGVLLGGVKE